MTYEALIAKYESGLLSYKETCEWIDYFNKGNDYTFDPYPRYLGW